MAFRRGYGRRRYYRRRFSWRRRFGRRLGRRRYGRRRTRTTRSSLIKLTWQNSFAFGDTGGTYNPFQFQMNSIPGFSDYSTTYSQFRIVKAHLQLMRSRASDTDGNPIFEELSNVLIVPSGPFASMSAPVALSQVHSPVNYLIRQSESALRQSRWQKQLYPNTTTQAVHVGFHPFTFNAAFAPALDASSASPRVYQRIWKGRNWTPMTWVNNLQSSGVTFFGPYVLVNSKNDEHAEVSGVPFTLTLYVQFRGQR